MTPEQARIISIMAFDHADWNGKMWELFNHKYTPEQVADAINARNVLCGKKPDQKPEDCEPRD